METTETVYGYDGLGYTTGDRVELHPGTDLWMRGARYGVVVGIAATTATKVRVRLDAYPGRKFGGYPETFRRIGDDEIAPCQSVQDAIYGRPLK